MALTTDSSINNQQLTANGDVSLNTTTYKYGGGAAYFDGDGDYITSPQIPLGTDDFTIEAWVYLIDRISSYPTIFGNYSTFEAEAISIQAGHNSSPNKYNVWLDGLSPALESTNNIQYNTWTHIVVTRSGNTFRLFIDGILNGTNTFTGSLNGVGNNISIGAPLDSPNDSIHGYIDDFQILKGIAKYTTNFTPSQDELPDPYDEHGDNVSLLMHMDGTNGSHSFVDSSINNFIFTEVIAAQISSTQTKFGNGAGYFGSASQYLTASSSSLFGFGTGDFTIEMWIYPQGAESFQGLFNTNNFTDGILIRWHANNTVDALYINGTSYNWLPAIYAPANTWSHIALVRDSGIVKMFVNGVNRIGYETNNSNLGSSAVPLIGASAHNTAEGFNGYIDELRITKGIARYTSNFVPQTAPFANPL